MVLKFKLLPPAPTQPHRKGLIRARSWQHAPALLQDFFPAHSLPESSPHERSSPSQAPSALLLEPKHIEAVTVSGLAVP